MGAQPTRVRVANEEDFPAFWPLLAQQGASDKHAAEARFRRVTGDPFHLLLLAETDSRLGGYAWAQNYGPHLRTGQQSARWHELYVREEARGQGLGRALFWAVREWARGEGVRWLQWQASPSAISFYTRLGLRGQACPDPDHPFYEIEFPSGQGEPVRPGAGV